LLALAMLLVLLLPLLLLPVAPLLHLPPPLALLGACVMKLFCWMVETLVAPSSSWQTLCPEGRADTTDAKAIGTE
jgi:hypothetical protein